MQTLKSIPYNSVVVQTRKLILYNIQMSQKRSKYGICPLCQRTLDLTFHHLIPKKLHRRTYYRKNFTKAFLNQGIDICRKCHSGIHAIYTEMELGKQFNTFEKITADEALQKHFAWVAKQRVQLRRKDA